MTSREAFEDGFAAGRAALLEEIKTCGIKGYCGPHEQVVSVTVRNSWPDLKRTLTLPLYRLPDEGEV